MDSKSANWPDKIYEAFSHLNIRIIANVPDAVHSEFIRLCQADTQMQVVTLTTEEEGVGLSRKDGKPQNSKKKASHYKTKNETKETQNILPYEEE